MRSRSIAVTAAFLLTLGVLNAAPALAGDQVGVVDTTTGEWHLRPDDGIGRSFYYGNPGDYPFMGDWNCDGVDTPGLYRQSDGYAYLRNANTQGIADIRFYFGDPGDIPLAGDWNGDGCDTLGLYRPSEGKVYLHNTLGSGDIGLGAAELEFYWGNPGDEPFAADTDGDGIDEIGLYRRSDATVFLKWDNTPGIADDSFVYGNPADRFVGGDFDGDGTDTVAIYRPGTAEFHLRNTNTPGVAETTHTFGIGDQAPIAGDFAIPTPAWEDRTWTRKIIDDQPLAGRWLSLATGPTGNPIMAYGYLGPYTDWAPWESLVIAACTNRTCTDPTITRTGLSVGNTISIDVGTDGNPVIAYFDNGSNVITGAICADPACSALRLRSLRQDAGTIGAVVSMQHNGYPMVTIAEGDSHVLLAFCLDRECTSTTDETLLMSNWGYTPLDTENLDDGTLVIASWASWTRSANPVAGLHLLRCTPFSCPETTEDIVIHAQAPDMEPTRNRPSVVTGREGRFIGYSFGLRDEGEICDQWGCYLSSVTTGFEVWAARCLDDGCSTFTRTRVEQVLFAGQHLEIPGADVEAAIGGDRLPILTYRNPVDGGLHVVHCSDADCTTHSTVTWDLLAADLRLAVDPYGVPIVISRESDGLTLLRSPN